MAYNHKYYFSAHAKEDFESISAYLIENWPLLVTENFMLELERLIGRICKNPKQFRLASKRYNVRMCVLSKHNILYFRESNNAIEIVRIFDTRQNPDKLTFDS